MARWSRAARSIAPPRARTCRAAASKANAPPTSPSTASALSTIAISQSSPDSSSLANSTGSRRYMTAAVDCRAAEASSIVPLSWTRSRARHRRSVVFPAPASPTKASTSLRDTSKYRSSSARTRAVQPRSPTSNVLLSDLTLMRCEWFTRSPVRGRGTMAKVAGTPASFLSTSHRIDARSAQRTPAPNAADDLAPAKRF